MHSRSAVMQSTGDAYFIHKQPVEFGISSLQPSEAITTNHTGLGSIIFFFFIKRH